MDDLDKELEGALAQNGKFDPERAEREGRKASARFGARLARIKRWVWIVFWKLAFAVVLCVTLEGMYTSDHVPTIVQCGVFAVFAVVGLAAFMLWHLVQGARIGVLTEIQRLRLDLVESKVLPREAVSPEALRRDVWVEATRGWKRSLGRALFIVLVLAIGFGWLGWEVQIGSWSFGGFGKPVFIGREADEWHVLPDNTIEAHARLTLTDWPDEATSMPIALPYKDGRIEAVTVGGAEVPWRATGKGKAELDLTGLAVGGLAGPIQVVWSVPLGSLTRDGRGYLANLRSLVPTTEFSLTVVLEKGSGYEVVDRWRRNPDQRQATCFRNTISRQPQSYYGSCDLGIQNSTQVE
jgi:hypothetical protein